MSQAGNKGSKKSRQASSKAAESAKSNRPPPRVTTVQKLHLRLQQVSISDKKGKADVWKDTTNKQDQGIQLEETGSRDSSPGIDGIPPPGEPVIKPPPPPPPKKQEVKRTAAQIFRELARCKAEQDAEVKRISALEFVATPEEALNKASIELEERETTARAERRMLALLALENAIVSKDQDLDLKKKIGEKALEEKRELRQLWTELRQQEQSIAEQIREKVCTIRERSRQAMAEHAEQKALEARSFGEEIQTLVREAQRQKEEERQQRAMLIQQIRQLESMSIPHFKELDLTSTAGHGLLSEMSICELKERLAILRIRRSEDLQEKNQKIVEDKKRQEEQMQMAEKVLNRFHEIQARQRQERKELARRRAPPVTSDRLQQLQQDLDTKRAERLRRAARRRLMRLPQRYLLETPPPPSLDETRSAPPGLVRLERPMEPDPRSCCSDGGVRTTGEQERLAEVQPGKGERTRFV